MDLGTANATTNDISVFPGRPPKFAAAAARAMAKIPARLPARPLRVATLVLFAVAFGSEVRAATTYYVRASGDDRNGGLTPRTALATIRSAGRLLVRPGDEVIVGPGTYREGNVQPRKSGKPNAPIGFFADRSGRLTGDPPGQVVILPPNAKDSTTGFILYGRHDIHIEGFEIDGAKDAGIQIRPRPRTGLDSTQIALVDNGARRSHIGIQVTAVGDVRVTGNRLVGNDTGLTLRSGAGGALRPVVGANLIEQNKVGIWSDGVTGGSITQNTLNQSGFSLRLANVDGLAITENQIVAGHARMWGNDVTVTDNAFGAGVGMAASTGRLFFARNRLPGGERFSLLIRGGGSQVVLSDNSIPRLYVSGAAQLDLERNGTGSIQATSGAMTAIGNQFVGPVKLIDRGPMELRDNQGSNVIAYGAELLIQNNDFTGGAKILGVFGSIDSNRAASLSLGRVPNSDAPSGSFNVTRNVIGGTLDIREGVARAVVENNACAGMLRVAAQHDAHVRANDAHGISCRLLAPGSRCILAENTSRNGAAAGLAVIGADDAVVENNLASANADCGMVVRRVKNLLVADNDLHDNSAGGISVQSALACDCNGNVHVTIDELITAMGIALGRRPLHDCDAADTNGDGVVGIGEIVLGVEAALNPPDPGDASVDIRSNRVERNGRFGIDVFAAGAVSASDNRVVQSGGIPLAIYGAAMPDRVEVADNVLGRGGAQGLLLDNVGQASVRNNVVFSNRGSGILLRDAPGTSVVNNLIYANRKNGIAVGGGGALPTADVLLRNNTIYANAGWGVAIGSAIAPSTGAVILDNILQHNTRGGIAATAASLLGLTLGFNLTDDGNGQGVEPAASDLGGDPQFIGPAGADGVLGGTGFADDDFHLRPTSPAVDAGSAPASALGVTGSAVAGQSGDQGIVDLGYHYGAQS